MEKTRAEKLAFTLRYLIKNGCVPRAATEDVEAAASLLVEQERDLAEARKALATKEHIVEVSTEPEHYRLKVRGTFVITDPRIYYGEIVVDDRARYVVRDERDWELHVARQLTRAATADWVRDIEERAFRAVRKAIAMEARQGGDAQQAPSASADDSAAIAQKEQQ